MVSTVESGIRQEQFRPELKREGLRRILEEFVDGYQETVDERLIRLGYLAPGEHIELNPSLEIRQDAKLIHLYSGIRRGDRLSLDLILLWSKILRDPQIITRNSQEDPRHYTDVPSIYSLISGRMGIYKGKNLQREEILHDENGYNDGWDYSVVSGRTAHKICTWEKPAYILTMVPDTAYVSSGQIKLSL